LQPSKLSEVEFLVRPIYAGQKDAACLANSAPLASLCDSQTGSHPVIQGVPASSGSKFPGGEEAGITPEANGRKRHIAVDPPGPDYEVSPRRSRWLRIRKKP